MSAGYFAESFLSAQRFLVSVPVAYKRGVLILDLRMPGMDGLALHEKMNELRSPLRIIFITADAQPGDNSRKEVIYRYVLLTEVIFLFCTMIK
jgi:FixJ family two-component response regulator